MRPDPEKAARRVEREKEKQGAPAVYRKKIIDDGWKFVSWHQRCSGHKGGNSMGLFGPISAKKSFQWLEPHFRLIFTTVVPFPKEVTKWPKEQYEKWPKNSQSPLNCHPGTPSLSSRAASHLLQLWMRVSPRKPPPPPPPPPSAAESGDAKKATSSSSPPSPSSSSFARPPGKWSHSRLTDRDAAAAAAAEAAFVCVFARPTFPLRSSFLAPHKFLRQASSRDSNGAAAGGGRTPIKFNSGGGRRAGRPRYRHQGCTVMVIKNHHQSER